MKDSKKYEVPPSDLNMPWYSCPSCEVVVARLDKISFGGLSKVKCILIWN